MKKTAVIYLLIFAVITLLMICYHSKLTSVLFIFMLVLPVISFLLLFISKLLLKVELICKEPFAEKKTPVDITVKITNRFIIPLYLTEIYATLPLKSKESFCYQNTLMSLAPFSTVKIKYDSPIKLRGVYEFGIDKVKISDLFNIFYLVKKIRINKEFTVLPRKLIINPITNTGESEMESSVPNPTALQKHSYAGVKPYEPGDPVKSIHWTMSAKQDNLMVKQFENSAGGRCIILADLNGYFPFEEENHEYTDTVIEIMLALDISLISANQTCLNIWYKPEKKECESLECMDMAEFSLLYDRLSQLKPQTEIFLPEMLADSYSEPTTDCSAIFFITSQLRKDFIFNLGNIEIFKNKEIRILLIQHSMEGDSQQQLASAVAGVRGIQLWRIDKDHPVKSINEQLLLYRKN